MWGRKCPVGTSLTRVMAAGKTVCCYYSAVVHPLYQVNGGVAEFWTKVRYAAVPGRPSRFPGSNCYGVGVGFGQRKFAYAQSAKHALRSAFTCNFKHVNHTTPFATDPVWSSTSIRSIILEEDILWRTSEKRTLRGGRGLWWHWSI